MGVGLTGKRTTIADLARLARVSKSAVSLALNNKPGVSQQTRDRIMKLVGEQGYTHRSMVRMHEPARKHIRFVTCLKDDLISAQYSTSSFFGELIHGLEAALQESGYTLIFCTVRRESLRDTITRMEGEHPTEGIVLLGTNLTPTEIQDVLRLQRSLVVLDTYYDIVEANFIVMNNHMGAYQAGAYLCRLGHRRIGYARSITRVHNFDERRLGFLRALQEAQVRLEERDVFNVDTDVELAEQQFDGYISDRGRDFPSAIFCESDYIAIGVVKALQARGLKVPDDISIVGFDDVPESVIVTPRLTTVHVEKAKLGQMAAQRLVAMGRDRDRSRIKIIIDTSLVERDSCSSPKLE
ncbi:MAG: substrate-binding domain-containing protein [Spirochaetia bacterium]